MYVLILYSAEIIDGHSACLRPCVSCVLPLLSPPVPVPVPVPVLNNTANDYHNSNMITTTTNNNDTITTTTTNHHHHNDDNDNNNNAGAAAGLAAVRIRDARRCQYIYIYIYR